MEVHLVIRGWRPCEAEERWCDRCAKSGMMYSAVYRLTPTGVMYWGTVVKCRDDGSATWTDADGIIRHQTGPKEIVSE